MAYIIDTNVLIYWNRDSYPISISPVFWEKVKFHIANGDIILCEEVCKEIEKGNDLLTAWLKNNKVSFPILKMTGTKFVKAFSDVCNYVITTYDFAHSNVFLGSNNADPYIIAYAIVMGYTVVTYEEHINNDVSRKIKIPNVCDHFNVAWNFKAVNMITSLHFTF
jgi:rRNA-processing protein FCF1